MSNSILEVCNVGKSYRTYTSQWRRLQGWFAGTPSHYTDHWVLRSVSFAISPGESIGILGRNGAGKSTLLKIIAGTLAATEGAVRIRGKISAILELGMGFNPEFTARQNVVHACGLMGYTKDDINTALPSIEAFSDIGDYFDQPIRTFSSGMQMRVAFAAATAFRPDILIVDEALSVGDAFFQAKCFERINELRQSGTALLYVSHSAGDIGRHCERALFIKDGGLERDGPVREVSNAYLDYLFGKRSKPQEELPTQLDSAETVLADATGDIFHTRPFYRKDEHRWGVGGAIIADYVIEADQEVFPSQARTHQMLRVVYKVNFQRDVGHPVYGLLVKTIEGLYLYGTNSLLAETSHPIVPARAGDIRTVSFELPLMLNAGGYLISVGVSDGQDNGELIPLDRRYDAMLLPVSNEAPGTGILDLKAHVEIRCPGAVA